MSCEFVKQDCDAVDSTRTSCEVLLDFLWCSLVVDVTDKDAARVDIFPIFSGCAFGGLFEVALHFAQFGGFRLHLSNASLHCRNLFLQRAISTWSTRINENGHMGAVVSLLLLHHPLLEAPFVLPSYRVRPTCWQVGLNEDVGEKFQGHGFGDQENRDAGGGGPYTMRTLTKAAVI